MDQLTIYQGESHLPANIETANLDAAMAGLSVHTRRAYERWIQRYLQAIYLQPFTLDAMAAPVTLLADSLSVANLKAWLGKLKKDGLGKQSLNQAKAAIVWLGQHMADLGQIDYSTNAGLKQVKAPKAEGGQRAGTWLDQGEVLRLLAVCGESEKTGLRNKAIVTLAVTCGLRRDELATVIWDDFGNHGKYPILRIHGKGEKLRLVKLPRLAVHAIEAWRKAAPHRSDQPMFPGVRPDGSWKDKAVTDREVWNVIRGCAEKAGLGDISPHDLRRTFARGAFEAGATIEEIRQTLGHSSVQTTERYINSVMELERAATDIWAEKLEPQGEEAE